MTSIAKCILISILATNLFLKIAEAKSLKFLDSNLNTNDLGPSHINKPPLKELCRFCFITLPIIRYLLESNETQYFQGITTYICESLKIADKNVCELAIKTYELSILSVARDSKLKTDELCSLVIGCSEIDNPILNWNVTMPLVPKPTVVPFVAPTKGSPIIKILQLTDIHIDFEYEPGSLADCSQPLCCRKNSNKHNVINNGEDSKAGFFGDYRNCDIPLWTVESMFDYISKNENFDFIYWTGDLPPHNVWNQTRTDQLSAIEKLTILFQKYFGNKAIYPTLGNHEAAPCNLFPTPNVKEDNISWLYSALAKSWTQTGLPDSLYTNITKGAFYTIKLFPKLRLISLNTNYCPKENFWLLINSTDPLGQLEWLANVLQESENNQEKVHIIGHIHPSECLDSWSANFYKIINRYESTIVGQIFGHSHKDEFRLYYDLYNLTRPNGIAYLGPSVTTTSYLNPGYRVYIVDGDYENSTFTILNHYNVFLNLTEANLFKHAKWRLEYSAKEAYGLSDLQPESWNNLVNKMSTNWDGSLFQKFYKFYSKSSDMYPICDLKCRKKLVCKLKQSRSDDFIPC